MRRLLLCLLTVLLLARGWAADAMAIERVTRPAPTVASQMAGAHLHAAPQAAAHAHCDDMALQDAADDHPSTTDAPPQPHSGCSTCDLCHNAVAGTAALLLPAPRPDSPPPGQGPVFYASADTARLHKPPIG